MRYFQIFSPFSFSISLFFSFLFFSFLFFSFSCPFIFSFFFLFSPPLSQTPEQAHQTVSSYYCRLFISLTYFLFLIWFFFFFFGLFFATLPSSFLSPIKISNFNPYCHQKEIKGSLPWRMPLPPTTLYKVWEELRL